MRYLAAQQSSFSGLQKTLTAEEQHSAKKIMIETPRVSTIDKRIRHGGLLICGLNYGLRKGGVGRGDVQELNNSINI
jgi:hypothetical protein